MTLGRFAWPIRTPNVREAPAYVWRSACATGLFVFGLAASSVQAADVEAVRLWRAPDHTRVVLDLSDAAEFSSLSLENPDRFVVDLIDSRIDASLSDLPLEGTPIKQVRSGIRKGSDLRLVFDLDSAVRTSLFSLTPSESIGHRIVIDLFDEVTAVEPSPVLSVESMKGRRDIVIANHDHKKQQ